MTTSQRDILSCIRNRVGGDLKKIQALQLIISYNFQVAGSRARNHPSTEAPCEYNEPNEQVYVRWHMCRIMMPCSWRDRGMWAVGHHQSRHNMHILGAAKIEMMAE